jgi:hypothetical protein
VLLVRLASAISRKLVEDKTRRLKSERITDKADVRALSNTEFSSELNTIFLLLLRGIGSYASETN